MLQIKYFRMVFEWCEESRDKKKAEPLVILSEGSSWYSSIDEFSGDKNSASTPADVAFVSTKIVKLFDTEVSLHQKSKSSKPSGDQKWVNDIIKAGTLTDKVAALAMVVQESPPHHLVSLDTLIAMALKKEQRTSMLAVDALKDLLIHNLLPDRHLIPFKHRNLTDPRLTRREGLLFWYEDQLISRVDKIIEAIETGMKSTVEHFKKHSMEVAADLLSSKPEKEARLLTDIVNKLGDPSKSICAKCMDLLKNVIRVHSAMKAVIVREVRQLISRPGLAMRVVYVAILFISQMHLKPEDSEVASQSVECYVSLFEKAVKQGEMGSRLLAALLHGINRAFPFLRDTKPLTQHLDSLFRIAHTSAFATSAQALTLISLLAIGGGGGADNTSSTTNGKEISKRPKNAKEFAAKRNKDKEVAGATVSPDTNLVNRFYRALYSTLFTDQVGTRSRNTMYFNLLFRSMKRDPSDARCVLSFFYFVFVIFVCLIVCIFYGFG